MEIDESSNGQEESVEQAESTSTNRRALNLVVERVDNEKCECISRLLQQISTLLRAHPGESLVPTYNHTCT